MTAEEVIYDNCNTVFNENTGEEEVRTSLSAMIIACEEYAQHKTQSLQDRVKELEEALRVTGKHLRASRNHFLKDDSFWQDGMASLSRAQSKIKKALKTDKE